MRPTVILTRKGGTLNEAVLARFALRACRAVGLEGSLTVLATSDREMQSLNRRFRGKNATTDVLSFPPFPFAKGFAGDIAISLDLAGRNAKRLGHSLADEIRVLVLHGILHLAGYDHEDDDGEMAARESELRRRLGLPEALIERLSGTKGKAHHGNYVQGARPASHRRRLKGELPGHLSRGAARLRPTLSP
jgi:probable rRNA maturation factor